ncbi:MAG: glycosyltransferase family 9 protein [Deltaproteobacteria bacterium]|nr:glycosyltransferase family 9 protein [Deltaproteobacteria bacterium]
MSAASRRRGVERILIVNLTRFGDLLQTSPAIAALRRRHPAAAITLMAEKSFADVCDDIPGIDRVYRVELDRLGNLMLEGGEHLLAAYRYVEQVIGELRAERFDLALNYSSSRMSAVFMGLLRIPDVRGWSMTPDGLRVIRHPWARLFATMCLNRRVAPFNLVDYYCAMTDELPDARRLRYEVRPAADAKAAALLAEHGIGAADRFVAMQLGASRAIRQWPEASFATLGGALAAAGLRVVVIGGGGDRALGDRVVAAVGAAAINTCGRTGVGELGALLRRAAALITGDTGPMHMAVAVGTPVVGLFFGPASPFDTGPYAADHVVVHTGAPCAPCDHNVTCLAPFCRDELLPDAIAAVALARIGEDWAGLEAIAGTMLPARIYRTGFDATGRFTATPLGAPPRRREDALRDAYRATFAHVLGGAPLPPPAAAPLDLGPFVALATLARDGLVQAGTLAKLARAEQPRIAELERLGRELEVLDRAIKEHGAMHPDTTVLTQMFVFGKENLEGDDVATLAVETARLYRDLARGADTMTALLGAAATKEHTDDARLHQ